MLKPPNQSGQINNFKGKVLFNREISPAAPPALRARKGREDEEKKAYHTLKLSTMLFRRLLQMVVAVAIPTHNTDVEDAGRDDAWRGREKLPRTTVSLYWVCDRLVLQGKVGRCSSRGNIWWRLVSRRAYRKFVFNVFG